MAAKNLPAARALAAEDHDPMIEALMPAIAARGRSESDPEGARALLRESVERIARIGAGEAVRPAPAVAMARLLPMAVRIDPDRARDVLWRALSLRPPLSSVLEPRTHMSGDRPHYLDLAELAARVGRYERAAAEVAFAPVADRLPVLNDESRGLGNEGPGLFRAAGAFDARVARALFDALPELPAPPAGRSGFRYYTKAQTRLVLAQVLGLPPRSASAVRSSATAKTSLVR